MPEQYGLPRTMGTKYYYENIPEEEDDKTDTMDDHDWKDFQGMSDAEKTLVSNQIDHQAKSAAEQVQKMCGRLPAHLSDYLGKLFKKKERIFN